MESVNGEPLISRPCVRLIIQAVESAPDDGNHEATEFGLELARLSSDLPLVDECRLEYDEKFYCDESWSTECVLRRAFKT